MSHEKMLVPFGWIFIGVLLMMILVPFLRRRADLLTTWNMFLVGSINFVGLASLKAAYESEVFRILPYDRRDYELYILGAITFYAALAASYYWIKLPRKFAGRWFRKWPPVSIGVLYLMMGMALGLALLSELPFYITGLTQIIYQVGNKGIVVAVVMAFAAWFREKNNPVLIAILIGALLFGTVLAVMSGGGRRTILSVAATIPICAYWFWLRYKSPLSNLLLFGMVAVLGILMLAAYTSVRHFDRRGEMKERTMANSFDALMEIPSRLFSSDVEGLAGQNAAQTSLATIHLYTNEHDPQPFHSILFVSTVFVPRAIWENKPVGLGYSLPKTARARGTRATWGPGIVGHGFHEGGLHMLVFYGILVGMALRFLDEQLVRQSTNPFLLAMIVAMSGHIMGWPRGDIGTFTIQIIASFLAIQVFAFAAKIAIGTGVVYPRTDGPEFVNQNMFRATLTSGK